MSISPKRILLVDDGKDRIEWVSRRLEAAGCEVVSAYDGREALDQPFDAQYFTALQETLNRN